MAYDWQPIDAMIRPRLEDDMSLSANRLADEILKTIKEQGGISHRGSDLIKTPGQVTLRRRIGLLRRGMGGAAAAPKGGGPQVYDWEKLVPAIKAELAAAPDKGGVTIGRDLVLPDGFKLATSGRKTGPRPHPHTLAVRVPELRKAVGGTDPVKLIRREAAKRREAVAEIMAEQGAPATVRQVFYLVSARGAVEKSEAGYMSVQRDLTDMRKSGAIDWDDIEDRSRAVPWKSAVPRANNPTAFELRLAMERERPERRTPEQQAKDLMEQMLVEHGASKDAPTPWWTFDKSARRPVLIVEKDALAPQVEDAAKGWDVPVISTRGFASLSQLHTLGCRMAEDIAQDHVLLWLHDWDRAGQQMEGQAADIQSFSGEPCEVVHVALTEDQVSNWNIQTRPEKRYAGQAAELDAIPPDQFREVIVDAIRAQVPEDLEARSERKAREVRDALTLRMKGLLYRKDGTVDESALYGIETEKMMPKPPMKRRKIQSTKRRRKTVRNVRATAVWRTPSKPNPTP